jgi:hypothetical protein
MCLPGEMCEQVYMLANKMEMFWPPFIVQHLELNAPFEEKLVSEKQLFLRDTTLVDHPDSPNELTELEVIWLWQNIVENAGTLAIQIVEKLPSFVAA